MAVSKADAKRCVVWFGQPSATERMRLNRAGWYVRVADASAVGGIGTRGGNTVVAVADLREAEAASMTAMALVMDAHPGLPWLALMPAEMPAGEPALGGMIDTCVDVFTAPVDVDRLLDSLGYLGGDIVAAEPDDLGITGHSKATRAVIASVRKYAPVDLPVLITGETGTGKEVAARALHSLSRRAGRPFAAINCGALPPNLVQSELFGHERGAFTGANARRLGHFETAAGGTVFLDEVGDLPADAQTSLLRFLQEGTLERVGSSQSITLDVRVLAATHVDLERAVEQGRFREDLYYRLNVLRLHMPALREREDDVVLLAQHFLDAFREHHGSHARTFSSAARQAMRHFGWPGNVRELLNRVQRAAVVAEDALITPEDLDLAHVSQMPSGRATLGSARVAAEREAVISCLRECHFNVSECARRLKVSRVTIYRLCKKHGLALEQLR
ncbi:DNA-binding NtrC family response regulator [Dyella sp. SG562]|uniref:sigma-54 dependent transcriptional regulator n=1 Tax=Dyella TaxID=231454 RepID=UPI0014234D12|nr:MULTISPECIES: sigma-54 dependent transcriptional regulator [unclassified Dyella]MBT2116268.1 sigma-54 dependent transcriptional regulator [Dyella sp. LX-1]MBT2140789.1 sigma-54 dependent transcriptional regulator [Dyella sp. LX-66]NII73643.1 DNA-binding NtrC family response regulator [Dyella sp. SG562]NKJ23136.1 DNA-binding NtrC family response regulator [Dyella sp. SG609]